MSTIDTRGPASIWLGAFGQGVNLGGTLLDEQFRRAQMAEQQRQFQENQALQQQELAARVQADQMRNQQANALLGFEQLAANQKMEQQRALEEAKVAAWKERLRPQLRPRGVSYGGPVPMAAQAAEGPDTQPIPMAGYGEDDLIHDMLDSATAAQMPILDQWISDAQKRAVLGQRIAFLKNPKIMAMLPEGSGDRQLVELAIQSQDAADLKRAQEIVQEALATEDLARTTLANHPEFGSVDRARQYVKAQRAGLENQLRPNISGDARGRDKKEVYAELKALSESSLDQAEKDQLAAPLRKELGLSEVAPEAGPTTERKMSRDKAFDEAFKVLPATATLQEVEAWLKKNKIVWE